MKRFVMMVRAQAACALFASCFVAQASDRTWDGGGGDANWGTAANWDGDASAPVANDALFFGGSARLTNTNNMDAGTSFAGITFNSGAGAFTLAGNALALAGNVSNLSASVQVINLPMAMNATCMIYGSNVAVTVNGVLSGAGGLIANVTNSALTLSAANTYAGDTIVTNGQLLITHKDALGSSAAGTRIFGLSDASLKLSGGIEIAEPIILDGARPNYQSSLLGDTGSNTVSGLVSKMNSNPRIRVESGGKTLVLAGGVTNAAGGGMLGLDPQSGSTILIKDKPLLLGMSVSIQSEYSGWVVFAAPSNTYSSILICDHNKLRTDVSNALCPTAQVTIGGSWVADGLLDLNGRDQTIGSLKTDGLKTAPGYLAVTSVVPATLTVNQSGSTVFAGALDGAVSLVKQGSGTLTFSNVVSKTTGDLFVCSGTVAVAETGGFANSMNVRVSYGGTFELRNSSVLTNAATVWLANGAKMTLASGVNEVIGYLYYGAVSKRAGTYGSTGSAAQFTDDTHFSGSGVLTVLHDNVPGTIISLR